MVSISGKGETNGTVISDGRIWPGRRVEDFGGCRTEFGAGGRSEGPHLRR